VEHLVELRVEILLGAANDGNRLGGSARHEKWLQAAHSPASSISSGSRNRTPESASSETINPLLNGLRAAGT
jgi:hypothetical protein